MQFPVWQISWYLFLVANSTVDLKLLPGLEVLCVCLMPRGIPLLISIITILGRYFFKDFQTIKSYESISIDKISKFFVILVFFKMLSNRFKDFFL